jgi:hypothetical protein
MASPLVQAFTPAEREALSKFKAEYLQKALTEAAGDSGDISALEIWNVPVAQEDSRVDVIIVKFLRAKYDPSSAFLIIVNSCCRRLILSLSKL